MTMWFTVWLLKSGNKALSVRELGMAFVVYKKKLLYVVDRESPKDKDIPTDATDCHFRRPR